jgi:hypothetical protein
VSPTLALSPEQVFLRRLDSVAVHELPGFVRGRHRKQGEQGRAGEQFIHALGAEALAEDIRLVYDAAKQVLGLRRRELVRAVAEGGGNVDAPQFRYALELGPDSREPSRALWLRRVDLLVAATALPLRFDELFPVACNELVIPFTWPTGSFERSALFDHLVERLEDFADRHGGSVHEDEDRGRTSVTTRDGSHVALDLDDRELSLRIQGVDGPRELMLEAQRRFADLAELMITG